MQKVIMIDARSITQKPCGVRRVAEQYLLNLPEQVKTKVIIHEFAPFDVVQNDRVQIIKVPNYLKRFNFILDMILISWLVIRLKPNVFISLHSFLPILSLLPKNKIFLFHDHFAAINRDFFESRGRLASAARLFFWMATYFSAYRASKIIVPSNFVKRCLSKYFPCSAQKVVVCHNPVEFIDTDAVKESLQDNAVSFLFIGNSRKYKGLDILLEAWRKYSEKLEDNIQSNLHIVSNEPIEYLNSKFANMNLSSVFFYSRISDKDLNELRKKAEVFVVPSREEGFGLPVIENLIWNKPMILSDIPVFKEIIDESESDGINWFKSSDANCLAQKLALFDEKTAIDAVKRRSRNRNRINPSMLEKFRVDIASERFFAECIGV